VATSITAAIGAGDRWLAVNAASTKAVPFYFTIDAEVFQCKSGAQTLVWECERGQNGTGRSAHAINSTLIEDVTAISSAASGYTSATAPGDLPATGVGLGLWANAKAAGDHRTIYSRLFFAAASASTIWTRRLLTLAGWQSTPTRRPRSPPIPSSSKTSRPVWTIAAST